MYYSLSRLEFIPGPALNVRTIVIALVFSLHDSASILIDSSLMAGSDRVNNTRLLLRGSRCVLGSCFISSDFFPFEVLQNLYFIFLIS